jgi:hypothetical protein
VISSTLRTLIVGAVAAAVLSVVGAAPAFAVKGCEEEHGKCLWRVNGAQLGEGVEKTTEAVASSAQVLKGKVSGTETELTTKTIKLEKSDIKGHIPGTGHVIIVYEKVEVVKPKNCTVNKGTVKTELLIVEPVYLFTGSTFDGLDDLFLPETGTTFVTLKFEGEKCSLNKVEASVKGEVAAFAPNASEELEEHTLESKGTPTEVYKAGATTPKEPKLELGGEAATYKGTAKVKLATKEKYSID